MASLSLQDWWNKFISRAGHRRRRSRAATPCPAQALEQRQLLTGLITTLTPTATSGTSTLVNGGLSTITGVSGSSGGTTTAGTTSGTSSSGTSSSGTSTKQAPSWLAPLLDWQSTLKTATDRYQKNATDNRSQLSTRLAEVLATYEGGEDLRAKQSEALLAEVRDRLESSSEELADSLRDLDDLSNSSLSSLLLVRDRTASALQRHTAETAQSDGDYQAAILNIQQTHSLLLKRADDDFQSAMDQATTDRQSALTAAGNRHGDAIAAAAARFDSAMDAADAAFDTAVDSAVGQMSATVDAELTAFDTAVSTAQAARDALTVPLSSAFDPHAPESNADYLAAVAAAQARLENRVAEIIAHFEQAMQSHLDQHETSLAAADATFQDSLETADATYAGQMQAAYQVHHDSVTEAVRTFDEAVQKVQERFDAATTQAFDTYSQEWKAADDTYHTAITQADATYESKTASLQKAYDEYKAASPAEYTAQVKEAADAWVADIMSARDSARPLVPTAAKEHWQTVVDSLGTLALVSDTQVQDAIQAFVAQLNTSAKAASSHYADDMNRSIGTFATYDE
ncbi:MAG: hypothetical protein ACK5UC_18600, partial [Planctomycetaceae bacterium]